jgi:acid stress-induced BolA-like protein IbaG/YrbA
MISAPQIEALIIQALPDAQVNVLDPNNDGQHFSAVVVAPQFVGLTMIKQHRLINEALKARIDSGEIHALQLKTFTPDQWQQAKSEGNVQFG